MSTPNHQHLHQELSASPRNRLETFRRIAVDQQGIALLGLAARMQRDLLTKLKDDELLELLTYLDLQQTTRLVRRLPDKRSRHILDQFSQNVRDKVEYLLRFNPRAAAGLMNLNYVEVSDDAKFKDVYDILEIEERTTGKFPAILVMDGSKLVGELPGPELVWAKPTEHILPKIKKIPSLSYDTPERKVIQAFLNHPHTKVAVVDAEKAVLGVINTDDIIPLLQDHAPGGLYKFAGVTREEDAYDKPLTKVRYRYKWLIINLGTAFLAASVVSLFEGTLTKFVLLAVYMPIVAGMGGNAGTQTLAVAIRGLTLKEIDLKTGRKFVINEVIAGSVNGLINGAIVAAIAVFFNHSPVLGVVLGLAMIINLIVAGFFGAVIPMLMKALGKDPASSATIFITTATDVFGFFTFLGLATILMT